MRMVTRLILEARQPFMVNASVTNRVHITYTQTGRQSILILPFSTQYMWNASF